MCLEKNKVKWKQKKNEKTGDKYWNMILHKKKHLLKSGRKTVMYVAACIIWNLLLKV